VAAQGAYVYIIAEGTLYIVGVSDPAQPVEVGSLGFDDVPEWGAQVAAAGEFVYVAGENRLHVVDTSDPAAPREGLAYDLSAHTVTGMAAVGDCVYVAAGSGGLDILCH
jgi:hypothetical protein